jgi:hypothetical protein
VQRFRHMEVPSLDERFHYELRSVSSSGIEAPALLDRRALGLCAGLHRQASLGEAAAAVNLGAGEVDCSLRALEQNGLIKRGAGGSFALNGMVINVIDAATRLTVPSVLVTDAVRLVRDRIPAIREQCARIQVFQRVPFERVSLLVLSNVLFDNWQIGNVERDFLGCRERPRGGRGWLALIQNSPDCDVQAGTLGNSEFEFGPFTLCAYGTRMFTMRQALRVSRDARARLRLIDLLSSAAFAEGRLSEAGQSLLAVFGLCERGGTNLFMLRSDEAHGLRDIAELISAALIELLARHKNILRQAYESSSYVKEADFNEYLIWWYHFFFSAVTARLAELGLIDIPDSGGCNYAIASC